MADGQPRRWGAWVAWVDLEQVVRAEFPEIDPLRVMHAVEMREVEYQLRCEPYDGGDLVDLFAIWLDPTVLPYRLQAQDWDEFDREAGRFRHYPLEVSWQSVCRFLDPQAVELQDVAEPEPTRLTERKQVELKCQHWLEELMMPDLNGRTRLGKDVRFDQAVALFGPKLKRAGFDRAWSKAIAKTGATGWSDSGPPYGSGHKPVH